MRLIDIVRLLSLFFCITSANRTPDVTLNTPEMIKREGYPAETHVIMTKDGYLLTLHRIPGGNSSLPVLLQHGFLGSSSNWVILGKGKALDNDAILLLRRISTERFLTKYICHQNLAQQEFSAKVISFMFLYDYKQINYALLPVILNHYPAGFSAKTVIHYAQGIQSGKFRQYDYGRAKNLLIYNSVEPPDYALANITVPIALFYSDNDWFVSTEDVKKLSHLLPNVVDMYEVPKHNFYHMDFVWAEDAPKLVYKRLLEIMRKNNSNNVTSME